MILHGDANNTSSKNQIKNDLQNTRRDVVMNVEIEEVKKQGPSSSTQLVSENSLGIITHSLKPSQKQ